jgi:tRNA threonylcarbamoyladenosine modification (KEOPS) complex Cgi121 subunit/molybdopterin converting factor small subunit
MIRIRLLGGAKKAIGRAAVDLDVPNASVADILLFLKDLSTDPRFLHQNNLIVAVNGVDSVALQGQQTLAKSGDTVTIVTVVHGGANYMLDGNHVSIIGITKIAEDARKLIDRLRVQYKDVSIQCVNALAVNGADHLLGVLRITLEAEKRKIMLANKRETEILLRLSCTGQISEAMKRAGLKEETAGCFVAISSKRKPSSKFAEQMKMEFETNDSVLDSSKEKRVRLMGLLGIDEKFDSGELLQYLLEKAAILVK